MNEQSKSGMPSRRVWWALLILGYALRALHAPLVSIHHADELWQYLEPAWHLTGGDWAASWEWHEGTRSWLIPLLLAGPMKLGEVIAPGTQLHVLLARFVMIGFSMVAVGGAIRLGARFSQRHAVLAGFVAAVWFELVYFAPRTLSDPLGVALFIGAAAALLGIGERTPKRLALAGALLGAVVMVRFQFAPAVAVLGGWVLWQDRARAWPMLAGSAAACLVAGFVDLCAGQTPFLWIWNSIQQNMVVNRSAAFGTSGPLGYFSELAPVWSWAALLLVPLAILGARRYPVLMAAALVNLLFHSLIPHKEYRFVLLTTTLFVLLAAIGSADLLERFGEGRSEAWSKRAFAGTMAGWLLVSALTGALLPFGKNWGSHGAMPRAFVLASGLGKACGVATVGIRHKVSTAWTFYGRRTPILQFYGETASADARAHAGSFDVMIAPYGAALPDPRLGFVGCSEKVRAGKPGPDYCVWHRPGGCTEPPPAEFHPSAVMDRLGV